MADFSVIHFGIYGGTTNGVNTPSIDTTGANFIILFGNWFVGTESPTISDNQGNSWTPRSKYSNSTYRSQILDCVTPTTNASQTFSLSGTSTFPNLAVLAVSWTPIDPSPLWRETGTSGASPLSAGSLTPPVNECLIVSNLNAQQRGGLSVNSGMTSVTANFSSGNYVGGGAGYLLQPTAAAINPAWTATTGSGNMIASQAVFTPAVGSGSVRSFIIGG